MTNPTMSAEERAKLLANAAYMYFGSDDEEFLENFAKDAAEQIRQAAQAARADEKAKSEDMLDDFQKICFDAVEQARADERRKTLEEEAAYHTKEAASWDRVADGLKAKGKEDAMHQAEGWAAYHESQAERLSETALANESGEPGEAV